ncbi:MAG: neutral zinc metallopeptidase [Tannerellaceae bacterium]|nr:neutral zinc metallopeptidase [Tannerellaceae bacterium]MCD8264424.1 neutral zinc metallopeptidase [Tannerellaceae bacterium]
MQWEGRRGSTNINDRRGQSGGLGTRGGCTLGGGIGTLILVLVFWLMGGNPLQLIGMLEGGGPVSGVQNTQTYVPSAQEDSLAQFVSVVLADTEDVWTDVFNEMGRTYRKPTLVLFTGYTRSACGTAQSATGPFYCSEDERIYVDLSFFNELANRYRAGGDFAYAYVLAHEVGHHVQEFLGTLDQVHTQMARTDQRNANRLSVALELQADFYAGVWANLTETKFQSLDPGDIQEALTAASAIGDDRLQEQAQGYTVSDSFTHGTSQQRYTWFYKGYTTGDITQGDTFN